MKIKTIPVLLSAIVILGCSTEEEPDHGFVVSTDFKLGLANENGQDLLNPETPGYFSSEEIILYSLEGNEKKRMYSANWDYPEHFRISEMDGEFTFHVMPDYDENQETIITLIQWNENDVDTLKMDISYTTNSVSSEKVWFNENLIWQIEDNVERYAEIIK